MRVDWQGVFPALMTEFHPDGALDLESMQRHARACLEVGCSGLIMLGTLGENSSLAPEEKEAVLRAAVEAADGRAPASPNTPRSLRSPRHVARSAPAAPA